MAVSVPIVRSIPTISFELTTSDTKIEQRRVPGQRRPRLAKMLVTFGNDDDHHDADERRTDDDHQRRIGERGAHLAAQLAPGSP